MKYIIFKTYVLTKIEIWNAVQTRNGLRSYRSNMVQAENGSQNDLPRNLCQISSQLMFSLSIPSPSSTDSGRPGPSGSSSSSSHILSDTIDSASWSTILVAHLQLVDRLCHMYITSWYSFQTQCTRKHQCQKRMSSSGILQLWGLEADTLSTYTGQL